jgi:eukaryotic-like serine/threonine-protein kinase
MSEAWKQWEGRSIDNRFPLRQLLGESDHSAVFLTESVERGGKKAAIKLVAAQGGGEAQIARWREIARLSHPNLLPLYQYGRTRLGELELVFAVMELADETLAEILPNRALSPDETKQMLQPVLEGLTFLHQRGLVHGDVQPSNILAVGENIKLSSDTIRPAHDGNGAASRGSLDTRPAATGSVEPAGDIYSLGITLTQALTQRSPFDSGSTLGHVAEPLQPPFDDIVVHALHPDPQLRWTAADIALRLNPTAESMIDKTSVQESKVAVAAAAAVPKAAPTKPVSKQQREPKPPVSTTERPAVIASVAPASVRLSNVAPPPPRTSATAGSNSLLRYAAVLGVAAVLTFAAVRGFRKSDDPKGKIAAATRNSAPASQPGSANSVPVAQKTPEPNPPALFSSGAPVTASARKAPELTLRPPRPSISPSAKPIESAPKRVEQPEPSPVAVKSEVKTARNSIPTPADVLQEVLPDVSHKALSTIHGTVRVAVRAHVDASGKVSDAQLDSQSGSAFFNDLALKAARKWQFQPSDSAADVTRSYVLRFEFTQAGPKASVGRAG